MKTKLLKIAFALFSFLSFECNAGAVSGNTIIDYLRPYSGSGVYISVTTNAICDTSVFFIELNTAGGKAMYAAALAALAANKSVALEVSNATGCKGWGTLLQSLYIIKG